MSVAANLIPYFSVIQRSIPKEVIEPLTEFLGKALSLLQHTRRKMAAYNLKRLGIAFAEEVSKKTILNWSMCVADQLRSLWFSKTELQGMVEDKWSYNLGQALARNRGVVLITAHLGNYELAGSYLASFRLPIHAVVEEIPGGHTDAVNRIRRRFGMKVIGYSDIHRMMKILQEGNILVLLADRNIGEKGIDIRFGESTRRLPLGPALLALRTQATVQTGFFVKSQGRNRYLCVIHPALDLKLAGSLEQKARSLTQKISEELVSAIRSYPDQWFVFQDEWEPRPPPALLPYF